MSQTNRLIPARRPDQVSINKKKKKWKENHRVKISESEKIDKYLDLTKELKKAVKHEGESDNSCSCCGWNGPKWLEGRLKGIEIFRRIKTIQTTDWLEYSEESWGPKVICSQSDSIERHQLKLVKKTGNERINIDLLKTTLKRIWNWKTPGHDGIHSFWFKKFISIHGWLAQELNRCLQGAQVPEWMTKGKTTLIQKDSSKGSAPNNYIVWSTSWSNNLPTNDVENTNSTNKEKDLLLANKSRIVPWRTEGMPQRIQMHSRSTHPKWEQDKTEKSSYGLDWLQKSIWYGSTKLDNTLSQNVQNITWSYKLHRKDHATDSRRKKLSWNKDPNRHFPRRYTITLTIHNSHDAT